MCMCACVSVRPCATYQTCNCDILVYAQLMSKSSEKPRLHQIPSEEMDSEDGGASSPTEPTYLSRARAESLREAESVTSKGQEDQINLQHALILNQVFKKLIVFSHNVRSHTIPTYLAFHMSFFNSPVDGTLTLSC